MDQAALCVFISLFDELIDAGELLHDLPPELTGLHFLVFQLEVADGLQFLKVIGDLVRAVEHIPEFVGEEELDVLGRSSIRDVQTVLDLDAQKVILH